MKKMILSLVTSLFIFGYSLQAQTSNVDPNAPYLKDKNIPRFALSLTNGKTLSHQQIPKYRYTSIIIFSPDCGHCEEEAADLSKNADKLKSVYFIWTSYKDMPAIKKFAEKFGLDKQANVAVGKDSDFSIPIFFRPRMTPFVALYDKGQLLKVFEQGVKSQELIQIINRK